MAEPDHPSPPRARRSSHIRTLLRLAVTLGLIGFLVQATDWRELVSQLAHAEKVPALLGVLLAGAAYPVLAFRSWLMFRAQRMSVTFARAHALVWIGQFYNAFLLGAAGGDAMRLLYLCRDQPSNKAGAAAALLADRFWGMATLLVFALLALGVRTGASEQGPALAATVALGLLVLIAPVVVVKLWRWEQWPARLRRWGDRLAGAGRLETLHAACRRAAAAPGLNLAAALCTFLVWWLEFTSGWYLARSLGADTSWWDMALVLSIVYAVTSLPISLGGHGLREGSTAAMLFAFARPMAEGVRASFVLSLSAVNLVWSLFGGGVYLFFSRRPNRPHGTTPAPAPVEAANRAA